jgi:hypothetical protein
MDGATRHQHRNAQRRLQEFPVHQCPSRSKCRVLVNTRMRKAKTSFPQQKLVRRRYAWRRRAAVGRIQLRKPRTACPERPPVASASCHDRRGVVRVVTAVQQAVRQDRAAIDSARKVAAGAVASSALLCAQRTDADGTTGLQPVVPLVRRPEHGRRHMGCSCVHEEPPASVLIR